MATSIKLKSDIKKIEAAIKSKATPKSLVAKLETQLDKLKSDLASLSSAKPKKGVTKTKVLSSLQKLKAKVKSTKSLSGYKKSGIDIKKDADVPALPLGKRFAKTTGNAYYEYRLNRADVKQPPKRYPKLEKGGYMAKGGSVDKYNVSFNYNPSNLSNEDAEKIASKYTKDWKHNNDLDEVSFYVMGLSKSDADMLLKELKMEDAYDIEVEKSKYASGGYMAKGGKITDKQMQRLDAGFEFIIYTDLPRQYGQYHISISKEKGDVVYTVKSGHVASSKKVKTFTSEKDAFDYLTNKFGVKVSRKKMDYASGGYMAKGGMTEHGLKIGDMIVDEKDNGMIIVSNEEGYHVVDLPKGKREHIDYKMASGGRTLSAINRDRAYKSDEAWEQNYTRKSRPKNPKYQSSSDVFEQGGEMHRLFEEGQL